VTSTASVARKAPRNRKRTPAIDPQALRELLSRTLVAGGASRDDVGLATALGRRSADPEPDASLPADEPPGFEPPGPRRAPAYVSIGEKFIASLRREYRKVGDGRTLMIGQREDVREWLDQLAPGKIQPRGMM
jgi:hypothetical protein